MACSIWRMGLPIFCCFDFWEKFRGDAVSRGEVSSYLYSRLLAKLFGIGDFSPE